jgi:MFS family permease
MEAGKKTPISGNMWFLLILFGLFGQIAWVVENMYFNLFVYNTIAKSTRAVTVMVQASGIAATLTTILAGAFSDRIGNRKRLISWGYIIWGLVTLSFAFINTENIGALFRIDPSVPSGLFGLSGSGATLIVALTLLTVVIMDCVMTFFGSTANDAAFNAWVTDNTDTTNRGTVESVLSILPLIAMLLMSGGMGLLIGAEGDYGRMFYIMGTSVTICGIIGLAVMRDSPKLERNIRKSFLQDIIYGFRPSTVKGNVRFYLVLLMGVGFSTAVQVYMPYIIIYMQHYLGFSVMQYSALYAGIILVSSVCIIFLGRLSDRVGKTGMLVSATLIFCAGLLAIYMMKFATPSLWFGLMIPAGLVMMLGFLLFETLLGALTRDYTPERDAGKLQGVRMCFFVLIPMFIGPAIGDSINQRQAILDPQRLTYLDTASDTLANVPAPEIFLCAALLSLLLFLPIVLLSRFNKKAA